MGKNLTMLEKKKEMNKMVERDTGREMETFRFQNIWLIIVWTTPYVMMQRIVS